MTKDSLGDRMKSQYENRTRYHLPRRTYTAIRIDGKAFHTYARGLDRPFDQQFMDDMCETARYLCAEIQGVKLAFAQSDEITLILTDFDDITTEAWFDGNIQKITSISASMAAAKFNSLRPGKLACFDSRVFTVPDPTEVENLLIWRQQDATRNSIQMAGQSEFSHKELQGVTCSQIQEKLFSEKGINWNDYAVRFKRGSCVVREKFDLDGVERSRWIVQEPPVFTQDRDYLRNIIPRI